MTRTGQFPLKKCYHKVYFCTIHSTGGELNAQIVLLARDFLSVWHDFIDIQCERFGSNEGWGSRELSCQRQDSGCVKGDSRKIRGRDDNVSTSRSIQCPASLRKAQADKSRIYCATPILEKLLYVIGACGKAKLFMRWTAQCFWRTVTGLNGDWLGLR